MYAGNYDEGFGREQHKTKWTGKGNDPAGNTAPNEERNGNVEETSSKIEENGEQVSPVVNGEVREVTAEA